MKEKIESQITNYQLQIPNLKYTTDNAVMVATAGYFRALKKDFIAWEEIKVNPNLELK
jgi:tRNA A37 threonylcarbamoyltransferase TsaD